MLDLSYHASFAAYDLLLPNTGLELYILREIHHRVSNCLGLKLSLALFIYFYSCLTMEKITDKIAALPADANYFSLEFFPPKTGMGFSNLRDRLDRMARALRPLFVNVTWGAGGSTATKSLELAEICQRELNLTTCLHLTCTNMSRRMIDNALEDAKALGIRNILALRGDPPRAAEYQDVNGAPENAIDEGFVWALDLVKYIKSKYGDYFCIGVAAYPEGHADESHPLGQSLEHDIPYLVEKTLAGADFLMTQLFFDTDAYDNFEKRLREHPSDAFKTIPIIPGLMPIQSYQMIKRTTKLSHARVPDSIMARLDAVKKDDEKVKNVGVDILCEIVEQVKEIKSRTPGPRGFHFYTLNLEKAVSFIVERTGLISSAPEDEAVIDDGPIPNIPSLVINGTSSPDRLLPEARRSRRQSTIGSEPRNRVIVSERTLSHPEYEASQADAGVLAGPINSRANTLAISEGEGVLGREATWDDYPNGRWGDARSPAYGEIDGYGPTLHVTQAQAVALWGHPKSCNTLERRRGARRDGNYYRSAGTTEPTGVMDGSLATRSQRIPLRGPDLRLGSPLWLCVPESLCRVLYPERRMAHTPRKVEGARCSEPSDVLRDERNGRFRVVGLFGRDFSPRNR